MKLRTVILLLVAVVAGVVTALATYGVVHNTPHQAPGSDASDSGLTP